MIRSLFCLASLFGGLGIALGAFGAHALKTRLDDAMLTVFETGVRYQMYHALVMFVALWAVTQYGGALFLWAGSLFAIGVVLFSGSLYLLALTGVRSWGMVTPIGGFLFLIGWTLLLAGFAKAEL